MEKNHSVSFQIGQLAEARTFERGFRGAWFRCKINNIIRKKGRISAYVVEYYDYPEESEETVELYGLFSESSGYKTKKELMLRPQFPAFYRESEISDVNIISEVIVAVADVRRVGDLVDWLSDGCYWSGTITEVKGDDQVKITLPEPPKGEGSYYEVNSKDLRPSLDWSPECGWMVPAPLETQNGYVHARLIKPVKQVDEMDEDKQDAKVTPRSSLDFYVSNSSHTSASSLPQVNRSKHSNNSLQQSKGIPMKKVQQKHGVHVELDIGGPAIGKSSCSDGVSSTCVRDVSAEIPLATCTEEQDHKKGSVKKMRLNETIPLNSTACDNIESAILDLEELVNRIKWLKQILKFGISPTPQGPTWEYVEHPTVSTPK